MKRLAALSALSLISLTFIAPAGAQSGKAKLAPRGSLRVLEFARERPEALAQPHLRAALQDLLVDGQLSDKAFASALKDTSPEFEGYLRYLFRNRERPRALREAFQAFSKRRDAVSGEWVFTQSSRDPELRELALLESLVAAKASGADLARLEDPTQLFGDTTNAITMTLLDLKDARDGEAESYAAWKAGNETRAPYFEMRNREQRRKVEKAERGLMQAAFKLFFQAKRIELNWAQLTADTAEALGHRATINALAKSKREADEALKDSVERENQLSYQQANIEKAIQRYQSEIQRLERNPLDLSAYGLKSVELPAMVREARAMMESVKAEIEAERELRESQADND